MPNKSPGGLRHVPVAVYACAPTSLAIREAEERGRRYAGARLWHVAGVWSDLDPALPISERPGWQAVTSALSGGMIRGIVVVTPAQVATDTAEFASLGVLIRERGGFLVDVSGASPVRRTPGQLGRRRDIADAASGWSPQVHAFEGGS
ncbi:hypothetical protein GT034_10315 [Streptomyces sp. SID2563]|uniref:hypothetical protein n=1 Tax=Streptomyces sp. SID2563 TaxID=2690255 RepID=UPI001369517D|nr:hypothetical protein [Streptomyces sp. SID2563]MYW08734.1 hypothetical protein [Streptomyces sp. SID2563]